jgi:hypothetical protein
MLALGFFCQNSSMGTPYFEPWDAMEGVRKAWKWLEGLMLKILGNIFIFCDRDILTDRFLREKRKWA